MGKKESQRKSKYDVQKKVVDLQLKDDGEHWHYTAIKDKSRLLASSNSKDEQRQHFCLNCLQGLSTEISRNDHFEYCKDNEAVRIEMPEKDSFVDFHND